MILCECGRNFTYYRFPIRCACGRVIREASHDIDITNGQMIVDGTKKTKTLADQQSDTIARVKRAVDRTKRIKSWIVFLRLQGERGLGDTTRRLAKLAGERSITADLNRIMQICGCKPREAVDKLNEEHPYA